MTVILTREQEALIQEKLQSGSYGSANDVIDASLRLLTERDAYEQENLDDLRREIAIGYGELCRGELIPGDQVFEELRQISDARRKAQG